MRENVFPWHDVVGRWVVSKDVAVDDGFPLVSVDEHRGVLDDFICEVASLGFLNGPMVSQLLPKKNPESMAEYHDRFPWVTGANASSEVADTRFDHWPVFSTWRTVVVQAISFTTYCFPRHLFFDTVWTKDGIHTTICFCEAGILTNFLFGIA